MLGYDIPTSLHVAVGLDQFRKCYRSPIVRLELLILPRMLSRDHYNQPHPTPMLTLFRAIELLAPTRLWKIVNTNHVPLITEPRGMRISQRDQCRCKSVRKAGRRFISLCRQTWSKKRCNLDCIAKFRPQQKPRSVNNPGLEPFQGIQAQLIKLYPALKTIELIRVSKEAGFLSKNQERVVP